MTTLAQSTTHIPVLRTEVVAALRVQPGGRYIDATVGGGGHAQAILEASTPGGQLLALDADPQAIRWAQEQLRPFGSAALLANANFKYLEEICSQYGFRPVHGILFDLGLSSLQLGEPDRGFSFRYDAPLDMRFNPSQELTAADIVNTFPEGELARLLQDYGEEPHHRRIAHRIIENRPLATTGQLARLVERAVGAQRSCLHPATRTFMALRIAVNEELENLRLALRQAIDLLGPSGRIAVISYHSLEDRIVKEIFRQESLDCICPPLTPICVCNHTPTIKLITKKPVKPSTEEVQVNPRSRSAKMRVAERL